MDELNVVLIVEKFKLLEWPYSFIQEDFIFWEKRRDIECLEE